MPQISFPGNKSGITVYLVLFVFILGVTFSCVRMNLSGKLTRYQKEEVVCNSQIEMKNKNEIEGY